VTTVVFETHSTSEDNEAGIATGWLGGALSEAGRVQAAELGERRRRDGIEAVYASDLWRAVQTAAIAFEGSGIPLFVDWRLRECDYGELNGMPRPLLDEQRILRVDEAWPGGESWRQAVARVESFLDGVRGGRVLVIGHIATRWALEHRVEGRALEELAAEEFDWRPGWEYRIAATESR
jgi:broad specificity phosphatase PhoE